jgi:hypothetical protein
MRKLSDQSQIIRRITDSNSPDLLIFFAAGASELQIRVFGSIKLAQNDW